MVLRRGDLTTNSYAEHDSVWKELGLAAPARRALVDAELYKLTDLKKITLADLTSLHGMGPNALALLAKGMKKAGLTFKK